MLTATEKDFVKDLIRASVLDIIWPSEIQRFIDEGVFQCVDDVIKIIELGKTILPHRCNPCCLAQVDDNKFKCRKLNDLLVSKDNTNLIN
eukprot:15423-Ditylum_brightwellii.AAC.1